MLNLWAYFWHGNHFLLQNFEASRGCKQSILFMGFTLSFNNNEALGSTDKMKREEKRPKNVHQLCIEAIKKPTEMWWNKFVCASTTKKLASATKKLLP